MRTIIFNKTAYKMLGIESVSSLRFQATILKEDYSLDDILEDLQDIGTIVVKEDDETVGTYNGYTYLLAVSMHNISIDTNISIELENTDIEDAIDSLAEQTSSLDAGIAELAEDVAVLNETQESQDAAIEELAESIL